MPIMLFRIQSEESVRSFIARNILINPKGFNKENLGYALRRAINSKRVKYVAEELGWEEKFGLNRLLYNHTYMVERIIIRDEDQRNYSLDQYGGAWEDRRDLDSALGYFCPDCVREDIDLLGFSYWKRSHAYDVKVCAKHNVKLIGECPFCSMPFHYAKHTFGSMWVGCNGRMFSECSSVANNDTDEFNKSRFYRDVCGYNYYISRSAAVKAIGRKISILPDSEILNLENDVGRRSKASFAIFRGLNNSCTGESLSSFSSDILYKGFKLYGGFSEFIAEVESISGRLAVIRDY
ncbi:hypothetical protein IB232_21330 [Pseudomonas sp. PDM15]|uniref:hypothetical protein n=1 Tax=Pseudomonas sp. PDM15 TaxID=2769303 RepID=UPI001784DAC6|nr:hypothetical protein [Pseudomonas sp. PDM15]MBD9427883.1 hypothetical protein [Pseudomonas sp. PDM15]